METVWGIYHLGHERDVTFWGWHKPIAHHAYIDVLISSDGNNPGPDISLFALSRRNTSGRWLFVALVVFGVLSVVLAAALVVRNENLALNSAAWTIPVVQAALVSGLVVERRRRQQAARALQRRDAELQHSHERLRDVGRRLVLAQDAERSRIARELHDDISQQLTLLRIDLQIAGCDGEILDRVETIGRSVHDMSWRMHPARLQALGLVEAVRSLQHEQSKSGLPVVFTHGDVPKGLAPDVPLCLFRVVQEALQNAIKYSDANKVLLDLRCTDSWIELTIVDDGLGFDLDATWGKGLGLISMRERVEANAGTLIICSQPGEGTRFDVRVPLQLRSGFQADRRPWMADAGNASVDAATASPAVARLKPLRVM